MEQQCSVGMEQCFGKAPSSRDGGGFSESFAEDGWAGDAMMLRTSRAESIE